MTPLVEPLRLGDIVGPEEIGHRALLPSQGPAAQPPGAQVADGTGAADPQCSRKEPLFVKRTDSVIPDGAVPGTRGAARNRGKQQSAGS